MEIAASAELVDLAAEGFDAGIPLGQFVAPNTTAVRLTPPFPLMVVGSPDYLLRRKRPERIADLRQHACLRMHRSNRIDRALVLYRREQGNRGNSFWAARRARLPHAPRGGDPGTCTATRPGRQSRDC